MDKLTKEQRHRCMSAIKGRNTKPELLVRKFLFSRGFRYRLNHSRLPGHPDLVLRKYRTVIFVNGCFWHGHEGCKYYVPPKTNVEFWRNKIERNKLRDKEEQRKLASMGWHCITVWECQLKPKVREQTLEALVYTLCHIFLEDRRIKSYEDIEEKYPLVAESLVVFLLLFVGFSCDLKNRKTKNLRDIYGQNLILPGHATWKIEGRDTVINIENLAPKLVVYYSSGTCAPCSLKGLHHWGKIIDSVELVGPSLEIVFIIKANRYDSLFFHSLNSEHFIFPVLCDKEGEFEENNLLPINKEYNAFLLDSNNEVVYVGSPLLGRKMRSLFISIVKVLNNDYRNGVNSDLPSSDTIDNISS